MSKSLTYTGTYVRHMAVAIAGKDGAKTIRIDLTSSWTAAIRRATSWSEPVEGQEAVDLKGSMSIMSISLEAGGGTFDLGSGIGKNFRLVQIQEGKSKKWELRWQYVTHMPAVAAKVESYVEKASRAKGDLRTSYDWVTEEDKAEGDDDGQQELEA